MKSFEIRDLATEQELDREVMSEIRGGAGIPADVFGGLDILSPDFFSKVTPIEGGVSIPTYQANNLAQVDTTIATNGYGVNGAGNNKFAAQSNYNQIASLLNPYVG